jgi:hypothetical protein
VNRAVRSSCTLAIVVIVLASGCGDDPDPVVLDGVRADVVLTRQRDLVDRGLVNVMTTNERDTDLEMTSRRLVATGFDGGATRERSSTIRAGRTVALQTAFGDVDDCADDSPVRAALHVRFRSAGGDEQDGIIPITDATVLDAIRASGCTAENLFDAAEVTLDDATADDRAVTATLRLRPTSDADGSLRIMGTAGTVLFDVDPVDALTADGVAVDGTGPVIEIPVEFSINRCDPHAVAEVTKRFGLDLLVARSGDEAVKVPVPVDHLVPMFEAVVDRCQASLE